MLTETRSGVALKLRLLLSLINLLPHITCILSTSFKIGLYQS